MIWSLLLLADPVRVAFFGNSAEAADLSSLLGNRYSVKAFVSISGLKAYGPKYVVIGSDRQTPTDSLDTFVPGLKRRIREFANLRQHPLVLLRLPKAESDFDRQIARPLTLQAARESGAGTFESENGSALGYAESLFFQIVDWKAVKAGWKVVSVDSEETDEGPAKNAIDGDPETYWHTQYSPKTTKYPHELVIDMGASRLIGGFRYVPRQHGGANGRVKKYEFQVSLDGTDWGSPVASGEFLNTMAAGTSLLKGPVQARFIKFRALSELTGNPYASMAELDVLPAKFAGSE